MKPIALGEFIRFIDFIGRVGVETIQIYFDLARVYYIFIGKTMDKWMQKYPK